MLVFSLLFFFFVPSFSRWRLVCHVSLNKNTVIYFIIIYPVVVHPLYHQDMGSSMFWMTTQAINEGLNFPPSPIATGKNSWRQLTEHLRLKWSVIHRNLFTLMKKKVFHKVDEYKYEYYPTFVNYECSAWILNSSLRCLLTISKILLPGSMTFFSSGSLFMSSAVKQTNSHMAMSLSFSSAMV